MDCKGIGEGENVEIGEEGICAIAEIAKKIYQRMMRHV